MYFKTDHVINNSKNCPANFSKKKYIEQKLFGKYFFKGKKNEILT